MSLQPLIDQAKINRDSLKSGYQRWKFIVDLLEIISDESVDGPDKILNPLTHPIDPSTVLSPNDEWFIQHEGGKYLAIPAQSGLINLKLRRPTMRIDGSGETTIIPRGEFSLPVDLVDVARSLNLQVLPNPINISTNVDYDTDDYHGIENSQFEETQIYVPQYALNLLEKLDNKELGRYGTASFDWPYYIVIPPNI